MTKKDIIKVKDSIAIQIEDLVYNILENEKPSTKEEMISIANMINDNFTQSIKDMIFEAMNNFYQENSLNEKSR